MRYLTLVALAAVLSAPAAAQPRKGDLVLSLIGGSNLNAGLTVHVNPTTGAIATLGTSRNTGRFHNWVRMAPNNTDLAVAEVQLGGSTWLLDFDVAGNVSTLAVVGGEVHGFELDGDNTLVCAGGQTNLWGVQLVSGKVTSFVTFVPVPTFNEMCIYRERGVQYVIANFTQFPLKAPKLYGANRNGKVTTILAHAGQPLLELSGIEVDPKTGDFITTDFAGPSSRTPEPGGVEVNRVSFDGKVTTLVTFGVNGCRVLQDDTVWLGGFQRTTTGNVVAAMRFDLSTNTVVTIVRMPILTSLRWVISAIEVYGSHPLTVVGQGGPASTIQVFLQSAHPRAPGAFYQLALSFGRRPGTKLPHGEWLHLNVLDPLFLASATNRLGGLLRNFSGQLSTFGSAQAQVVLPARMPPNLGITVFVAGVFYDRNGVFEVTNTHWFEL